MSGILIVKLKEKGGNILIKPKKLRFGDTLGVVAPSSPSYEEERIEMGKRNLEEMGFKIKMGKSCYSKYGYLSGRDDIRANDINEMFSDNEVDGIICLRGGYGTPRILDKIDYENIKRNPKVFVGYSDITAIHIAINKFCDLVTFHGPMVTEMNDKFHQFSKESLLKAIMESTVERTIINPNGESIKTIYKGCAEGILVGGNLSLISSTIGTPYEIDTKGKILFIEEINEEPYKVDRMMTQLKLAGKFNDSAGIILGDWNKCVPEEPERSLELLQVFEDILIPLKKPTIYNLQSGHCKPMITLPLGVEVFMDAGKGEVIIKESGVI